MTDRRNLEAYYPFTRLSRLLDGLPPGRSPLDDGAPILLSIGEPQHQPPAFVAEEIHKNAAGWSRYPPARGTRAYREAATDWLLQRYGLPRDAAAPGAMLDPERWGPMDAPPLVGKRVPTDVLRSLYRDAANDLLEPLYASSG